MDITQWLNESSDEDNSESFVDDKFNDPDFEMPDQNQNEDNSFDENEDVGPVSDTDDHSNTTQTSFTIDYNQLNWGLITGNLNYIPYNPSNDFVGINPDIIDSMHGCSA